MKTLATQHRFVELRAVGCSYVQISRELGVSKTTLVEWSKRYRLEISNLKAMELDALQKRLKLDHNARLEMLGGMLARLQAELSKRDLTDIPTDKLIDQISKLATTLAAQQVKVKFLSKMAVLDSEYDETMEWQA